jgi:hypothetical protein
VRRPLAPLTFLLLTIGFAGQAVADGIAVNDTLVLQNRPGLGGGEFGVIDDDPAAGTSFDFFVTFCVEENQKIIADSNEVYRVDAIGPTDSQGRSLSTGAAWLYRQFLLPGYGALGALGGMSYLGDEATATGLQHTLWYLQGYMAFGVMDDNAHALAYYTLVNGVFPGTVTNAYAGADVQIMQLVRLHPLAGTSAAAQDQLVYRQVPEPGLLLLVGAGLVVAAARLRRR